MNDNASKAMGLMRVGHLKSVYRLKGPHGFAALLVSPAKIMKRVNDPPEDVSDEIQFWMG